MAFNPSNQASGNTRERASGFINFYLPSKDGKDKKLGAIPLVDSNLNQKALVKWLKENPEANTATVLKKLKLTFNSTEVKDGDAFDL